MPRLPGISQKDAVRVFQKLGYRIVRESGHLILSNGERRLVIPRHDPINAITMGASPRSGWAMAETARSVTTSGEPFRAEAKADAETAVTADQGGAWAHR